ncbi:MAG: hypothetical protein KBD55_01015 [Candidatus Pacebacteria bacterium]|nr:hypothetical protein [Candidatus Paceibacterota bacterium]
MSLRSFIVILCLICAVYVLAPQKSYAIENTDILFNISPENPAPNQNVLITLNSYATDLDTALISWKLNGKLVISKIGEKSFSATTGASGTETTVVATISTNTGNVDKKLVLKSNNFTILWQANDSFVPPFYKGKALPSAGSEIKVVAMSEIKTGSINSDSNNLIYSWQKDYNNEQESSGYGKNYMLYVNDYLDDVNMISVTANTLDMKQTLEASVQIRSYLPKISFYNKDSKFGIHWEKELAENHLITGEEILVASPFFISPKDISMPRLVFNWYINDVAINSEGVISNILPLRAQTNQSGRSTIKLIIENLDKVFANSTKEINIQF